jgi:ParB family chromosome partitioning protein
MMRLLGLPEPIKQMLDEGALSAGHARALLTAADPLALARQVVSQGLNVRQTEKLAQTPAGGAGKSSAKPGKVEKDTDVIALERSLSNLIGLHVTIDGAGKGGVLAIHYNSLEQLDDVIQRLGNPLN